MNTTEKVSIIVPMFNAANYIENCLNSIQNQSFENLEIIVIDDNSIDDSYSIVERKKDADPRIVLRKNNSRGYLLLEILG